MSGTPDVAVAETVAVETSPIQPQDQTTITTTPTTTETPPKSEPTLLNKEVAKGPPEKYEAFATPEGYTLDEAANTGAQTLFKEMGLTQVQAQKLVDFYSEHAIKSNEGLVKAMQDQRETWQNEARNHPDLKGKLDAGGPVLTTISRALDSLGDAQLKADFRQAMDMTGAGDNPAFIRAFYKMASKLTEGSHVAGNGPSPHGQARPGQRPPSAAQAMYPNLPTRAGGE